MRNPTRIVTERLGVGDKDLLASENTDELDALRKVTRFMKVGFGAMSGLGTVAFMTEPRIIVESSNNVIASYGTIVMNAPTMVGSLLLLAGAVELRHIEQVAMQRLDELSLSTFGEDQQY